MEHALSHPMWRPNPAGSLGQQLMPGKQRIPDRDGGLAQELKPLRKGVLQGLFDHDPGC
jgi:hypothetical protein